MIPTVLPTMELGSKVGNFCFWDENVFGLGNKNSLFSKCCLP
jgi:hypothetical protein